MRLYGLHRRRRRRGGGRRGCAPQPERGAVAGARAVGGAGGLADPARAPLPAAPLRGALDDFLRLYRISRTDKAAFMTEQMERFFRAIVAALVAEGRLELIFLTLGGVRTAAVLSFPAAGEAP